MLNAITKIVEASNGADNTGKPLTTREEPRMADAISILPVETWKPIPGYEGLYEASDAGRVRSLDRSVPTLNGTAKVPTVRHFKGRIIAHYITRGYPVACLTKNGRGKTFTVARLVLAAFVGPKPPDMECCHCNGDRSDSRLCNLRWDTNLANQEDRVTHGSSTAKLSAADVIEIRRQKGRVSGPKLAAQYHVSCNSVYAIWNGTRKTFRQED